MVFGSGVPDIKKNIYQDPPLNIMEADVAYPRRSKPKFRSMIRNRFSSD